MKTKEFIKRVEELGYGVINYGRKYNITNNGEQIATVDEFIPMQISNYYWAYDKLCNVDKEKFYNLLVEYAKTPIEERIEPKKYYLKHKWMGHEELKYLELDTQNDEWYLGHKYDSMFVTCKNEFTLEEIDEIKERFKTDLSDFEVVEVEDENPGSVGRFDNLEHGKKYYLRNFSNGIDMNENYLNFSKSNRSYILSDRENDSWHQTKFTKKDIIKLITCQEIHLDDFDIVEVE